MADWFKRPVDRLVADVPAWPVGPTPAQVRGDLLGAPLQFQLGLNLRSQILICQQATLAWAPGSLPRPHMSQVAVMDAPVVLKCVAAQLSADGRGRSPEPFGYRAYSQALRPQGGDSLSFQQRQEPTRSGRLGQPCRREPSVLRPPSVSGLASDAYSTACIDRPHA